jgi:hypothetical protein
MLIKDSLCHHKKKMECNITLRKGLLSLIILFPIEHFQYDVNQKNIQPEVTYSCNINIKKYKLMNVILQ